MVNFFKEDKSKPSQEKLYEELLKFLHPRSRSLHKLGVAIDKTMPTGWGYGVNLISGMLKINPKEDEESLVMCEINGSFLESVGPVDFSINNLGLNQGNIFYVGQNVLNYGIVCSVGYPFQPENHSPAVVALTEAKRYLDIFSNTIRKKGLKDRYASVVLCFDLLKGFWIQGGYMLHSTERKKYRTVQDWSRELLKGDDLSNIIIIDKTIYEQISKQERSMFQKCKLVDFMEAYEIEEFCTDPSEDYIYFARHVRSKVSCEKTN